MRSNWVNLTNISRVLFAVCIAAQMLRLENSKLTPANNGSGMDFRLHHLLGVIRGGHSHKTLLNSEYKYI